VGVDDAEHRQRVGAELVQGDWDRQASAASRQRPFTAPTRFDDQMTAMLAARDEGLIAGVGLSNVNLEQLTVAQLGVLQTQLKLLCGCPLRSLSSVSPGRRRQIRAGRA
jgi:hypothetical protein